MTRYAILKMMIREINQIVEPTVEFAGCNNFKCIWLCGEQ